MYFDWYADVTIAGANTPRIRHGLFKRLGQRLNLCLARFNNTAGNIHTDDILQVVAVVGVVSQVSHAIDVLKFIFSSSGEHLQLKRMQEAHRFVHFHKAPTIPQGSPVQLLPDGT